MGFWASADGSLLGPRCYLPRAVMFPCVSVYFFTLHSIFGFVFICLCFVFVSFRFVLFFWVVFLLLFSSFLRLFLRNLFGKVMFTALLQTFVIYRGMFRVCCSCYTSVKYWTSLTCICWFDTSQRRARMLTLCIIVNECQLLYTFDCLYTFDWQC